MGSLVEVIAKTGSEGNMSREMTSREETWGKAKELGSASVRGLFAPASWASRSLGRDWCLS